MPYSIIAALVFVLVISWVHSYTVITKLNHDLSEAKLALEVCQNYNRHCSATIEAIRHADKP